MYLNNALQGLPPKASTMKFVAVQLGSILAMQQVNLLYDVFLIPHKGLASPGRSEFNVHFRRSVIESVQDVPILSEKVLSDRVEKVYTCIASQGGKFYMQVERQTPNFPAVCWKEMSVKGSYLVILKSFIGVAKKRGIPFTEDLSSNDVATLANVLAVTPSLRQATTSLGHHGPPARRVSSIIMVDTSNKKHDSNDNLSSSNADDQEEDQDDDNVASSYARVVLQRIARDSSKL